MKTNYQQCARIFKAFSDETRLLIVSLLQDGEQCACDLLEQVSISQSTLSHHMKILIKNGVISARKEGKWMYYSISQEGCEKATAFLNDLIRNKKESSERIKNVVPKKTVAMQLM
ncbi:MAG: metalloregulator ArsR/SmtB family transcription factor [Defluviitaleaceae bacterium]|nr:metalloregulator ArsR/SmtB family transcription factor [Defluviitaleaceae bacterium]